MTEKFTVEFNGYFLTQLFDVTEIRRDGGSRLNDSVSARRNKKGVRRLATESTLVTIPMSFYMYDNIIQKRRELSRVLNVDEPCKLIFGDEPDKYYLAKPSETLDFEDARIEATGTITWQIFDGVAHSIEEYTFENNGSDPRAITINNPGTEPMLLEMEAVFNSDCGFLGLQNEDLSTNALFGSIEEVDGYHYESSDLLFDDHLTEDRGWVLNNGITPPVTPTRDQNGTVSYSVDPMQSDPNEGFARPTFWGEGDYWHGPSLTKLVPADKNGEYAVNWHSGYRIDFNNGSKANPSMGNRVGHNSVTYVDENDEIIVSVVFEDNNPTLERSDVAIYVDGKRVLSIKETANDYYVTGRKPWISVDKIGDKINVKVFSANLDKTFFTTKADAQLRKITWYAATYQDKREMANVLLRALQVRKHNVDNWEDIPNKFAAKDILKYGKTGQNIHCTVNENQGLQFRDPGSSLIYAPPGVSTMFLAWSDFAEAPTVKLTGRAAYV